MGRFKPLLVLNGKPMIRHAIDTLRAHGVAQLVIVTGSNADVLEAALCGCGAQFVRNERYAQTQMFDSARRPGASGREKTLLQPYGLPPVPNRAGSGKGAS